MQSLSFVADARTMALIGQLGEDLNAATPAEVFRKSLALLRVAVDAGKSSHGVVTLRGRPTTDGVCVDLGA